MAYWCGKTDLFILLSAIIFMLAGGCNKTEALTDKPPTCSIKIPKNDDELLQGETIDILVEAADTDGNVKEVIFRIDDIAVGKAQSLPYLYQWNTDDAIAGRHTIKATAIDNSNNAASDGIDILLVEEGSDVLGNRNS